MVRRAPWTVPESDDRWPRRRRRGQVPMDSVRGYGLRSSLAKKKPKAALAKATMGVNIRLTFW